MSVVESLQCEVSLVKSVQEKMADLLLKAPFLNDEGEDLLHRYIHLLRTRSEEMIIFIQVMLKIKQELAYARLDLERSISLKVTISEDERRVNWLSERLKKLSKICHNYFYDLHKELSKASIYGDENFILSEFTSPTCICGMMKSYVEQTEDDIQNGVKKVLESSSDVLVYRQGSTVQKVFKPSKTPVYETEVVLDQGEHSDEEEVEEESQSSLSFHSLALHQQHPEGTSKKNGDELCSIVVQRNEKSKLDSLIKYQKQALEQLVENLNNLYTGMGHSNKKVSSTTHDTVTSKQQNDAKMLADGSFPEIKESSNTTCDSDKVVASVQSDVSDDGTISTMLIPIQKKDGNERQHKKKEVFPRSASVWCDYSTCTSTKVNDYFSSSQVSRKDSEDVPTCKDILPLIKSEKGVVMKRAVNRVKAITKLKRLANISSAEIAKRKRIQCLLGNAGLQSNNKYIAVDAAKALGELKCRDEKVVTGLQAVINENRRKLLVYECARSLILLGSWHESAMDVLTYHLKYGNKKVQEDILLTLKKSPNAHFITKSSVALLSLSNALTDLLDDEDTNIAFNAALSLGYLCIHQDKAKWLLLDTLRNTLYTTKYEALNVLVKQMNCQNDDVIDALLLQISSANCWKHRMQAINLLRDIGLKRLNQYGIKEVFEVLQELLWNHSNKQLRSKVVAVMEEFGLRKEAVANVFKRLGDKSESVRADSIVALTTLQMKGERELKMLLDMFDLDSSTDVRTQVIKAFVELKWDHPQVMRVLEDRQKADDVLAQKALTAFNFLKSLHT